MGEHDAQSPFWWPPQGMAQVGYFQFPGCRIPYRRQGCDAPPLEPWHAEALTAEFAADRADDIRTFEDYRQLEDELFQELDEKIYARVGTRLKAPS